MCFGKWCEADKLRNIIFLLQCWEVLHKNLPDKFFYFRSRRWTFESHIADIVPVSPVIFIGIGFFGGHNPVSYLWIFRKIFVNASYGPCIIVCLFPSEYCFAYYVGCTKEFLCCRFGEEDRFRLVQRIGGTVYHFRLECFQEVAETGTGRCFKWLSVYFIFIFRLIWFNLWNALYIGWSRL